jgi:hypothetical protein
MKFNYVVISIFLFFTHGFISAQNSDYYDPLIYNIDTRIEHNVSGVNTNIDLSIVKGSPYENKNFQLGKAVNSETGNPQNYYLRYNVYNDVFELKKGKNDTKTGGLIKSENIYVSINNREYHYKKYLDSHSNTKEGYFILLKKGNKSSLYLKKTKDFKDKVMPKDSFEKEKPAAFIDNNPAYYLQKGDVLVSISSRKKKFLEQYPDISKKLGKYIKSEKISLKNEKDVIKLFTYLDTLLK